MTDEEAMAAMPITVEGEPPLAFCAYCGYSVDREMSNQEGVRKLFADHILSCPKHPLAAQTRINMILRYVGGILDKFLRTSLTPDDPNADPGGIVLDRWSGDFGPVHVTLKDVEEMLAVEKWDEKADEFYSHLGHRWYRISVDSFEESQKAMLGKGFLKESPE